MKVAIATQDLKEVNAHFAGARLLAIYEVTAESSQLLEAVGFDQVSQEDGAGSASDDDAHEDRITPRIDAIRSCSLLFVRAIGGPAAAKVVNARIHPIKVPQPEPIAQVLERVQTMLRGSPPPWLRKVLNRDRAEGSEELSGIAPA